MGEGLFPAEVVKDVPRVTLTGSEHVYVEQHRGLLAYQPEEVVFRTGCGMLRIAGGELRLKRYTACEAEITGRVDGIAVEKANGGGGA
ncbi:MAG: YabP/YqfC family sporulation protein [Aristaeellaceae bacterium]